MSVNECKIGARGHLFHTHPHSFTFISTHARSVDGARVSVDEFSVNECNIRARAHLFHTHSDSLTLAGVPRRRRVSVSECK